MTRARAWAFASATLAVILIADQVTKVLVRHHITPGDENAVFPAVDLVYVKNRGVAFSAFEDQTALVVAAISIAVGALVAFFAANPTRRLVWLPTGLLAGGAAGNILDRIRDGAVTDFVKLPAWPAFNVADVAITFGVLALLLVLEGKHDDAPDRRG